MGSRASWTGKSSEKVSKSSKRKLESFAIEPQKAEEEDDENKAGEFVVEAIRDRRELNGVVYFFIKWRGYPEYDNTWEPEEHLTGCRALVDKYLLDRSHESQRKAKKAANKKSPHSASNKSKGGKSAPKRPRSGKGRGKAIYEDVESDDDNDEFNAEIALEKTRNYIEFDYVTNLPTDRSPKRMFHATVLSGKLRYFIQWKNRLNDDADEEVSSENSTIVDGDAFKLQFPQMVIQFYESRTKRSNPVDEEFLAERACHAMIKAKERAAAKPEIGLDSSDEEIFDKERPVAEVDKFGLPMNLDSSSCSSSSGLDLDSD